MANLIETRFVTSREAAQLLGAKHVTVSQLCQHGKLPGVKVANRWLIPREVVEKLAKTYRAKPGRPRSGRP